MLYCVIETHLENVNSSQRKACLPLSIWSWKQRIASCSLCFNQLTCVSSTCLGTLKSYRGWLDPKLILGDYFSKNRNAPSWLKAFLQHWDMLIHQQNIAGSENFLLVTLPRGAPAIMNSVNCVWKLQGSLDICGIRSKPEGRQRILPPN